MAGNLLLVGAALPLALDPSLSPGVLVLPLAVMGCGAGLGMAGMQTAAVEAVPAADAGAAALGLSGRRLPSREAPELVVVGQKAR